jgi:predicted CXXCH cytochrome family protein
MYTLKTVQNGSDLEVSFTGNSDDAGKQFVMVLKGDSNDKAYNVTVAVASDNSIKGTANIPSSDIPPNTNYTVELYYADNQGNATGSTIGRLVLDNPNNKKLYQVPDSHVDINASLKNANQTGLNNLKKQRTGQKMHGFYQNNTNSCASCHQTHTSKDDNLLFKDGVYSTCSACHDGTTGAYNNFSPKSNPKDSVSGTFDISADTAHGSLHQADGSIQISAAPGGNNSTDPNVTGSDLYKATWGQNFECSSCHSAHGGGSGEENNLSTDPLGWGHVEYVNAQAGGSKDQQNGKLFKGLTIHSSVPGQFSTPFILVRKTLGDTDVINDKTKISYLYFRAGVKSGQEVIQTYRWDGTSYVPDFSLWLRDAGYVAPPFQNANTVLYDNSLPKQDITATGAMTVVWRDGFAFGDVGSSIDKVTTADISIGIDVETVKTDAATLYDKGDSNYIVDSGTEMTKFCSACHTDYMTDPVTGQPGTLTGSHRHITTVDNQGSTISGVSDEFTCVRCHFAHGTKSSIMKNSSDKLATTTDTISDTNHSSALRRYVDMDSCYTSGCHNNTDSSNPLYMQWSY